MSLLRRIRPLIAIITLVVLSVSVVQVRAAVPVARSSSMSSLAPTGTEQVIGRSHNGIPLTVQTAGSGDFKIVIAAENNPLASQLAAHYQARPAAVPDGTTLWFLPNINPDPDNTVDVLTNTDTRNDSCATNDGALTAEPFSAPETRALRTATHDAWFTLLFVNGSQNRIWVDSCRTLPQTVALANQISGQLGYPINPLTGVSGHFIDYQADRGGAAIVIETATTPTSRFSVSAIASGGTRLSSVLQDARLVINTLTLTASERETMLAQQPTDFVVSSSNSRARYYADRSFIHPISAAVAGNTAYIVDTGRVLALDLAAPTPPTVLLRPSDRVENAFVTEPLDLAVAGDSLFVLDRVGDVYQMELATGIWSLDRYDRPIRDVSSHYYVSVDAALQGRYLLEASYQFAMRYDATADSVWEIPDARQVGISTAGERVYLLLASDNVLDGSIIAYTAAEREVAFRPTVAIRRPRQIFATTTAVYVLDRGGQRVMALDPTNGRLLRTVYLESHATIGSIWAAPDGSGLTLFAPDAVYFVEQSAETVVIPAGEQLTGTYAHDLDVLTQIAPVNFPVGSNFAQREFQMPGAPRHYRLGVHEGFDFYWGAGTNIRAVADGVVMRASTNYRIPGANSFTLWRDEARTLGYTSDAAHDFFRGRQIWIDHGDGIITRYAHLSTIADDLFEGAAVTRGQVIGQVGNSGSPASVEGPDADAHLHFELWVGDPENGGHYLGQYMRPIETREWVAQLVR